MKFNSANNFVKYVYFYHSHFIQRKLRHRNMKSFCEKVSSGLPKDTQLVNVRARILTQVI